MERERKRFEGTSIQYISSPSVVEGPNETVPHRQMPDHATENIRVNGNGSERDLEMRNVYRKIFTRSRNESSLINVPGLARGAPSFCSLERRMVRINSSAKRPYVVDHQSKDRRERRMATEWLLALLEFLSCR